MDPDLEAAIEAMPDVSPWHALSVESARRLEDELFATAPDHDCPVREFAIAGPGGDLPIRAYRPAEGPLPTLVFYHGGGYTLGTLDSVEHICVDLAEHVGCLVLSVDYRLAPEDPFPAAVEDAWAALGWAHEHADAIGGDGTVAVGGTSAGGGLAAATALRAREESVRVAAQLLLYPMLAADWTAGRGPDAPLLSAADVEWFRDQYLASDVDRHNPLAAPLRAATVEGLPPAVVGTAGHDPLSPEGEVYAERLAKAGVDVAHHHSAALCHGFCSLTDDVPAAADATEEATAALRERL